MTTDPRVDAHIASRADFARPILAELCVRLRIACPPSCRRDYCDWIAEPKRDETRTRRVGEAIAWLRDGKRRNWRCENC